MNFDQYAKEIHAHNVKVGWWNPPQDCLFQKLQLVSTEVSEATEGERKNLMDDKLPHRKMGEVELADALIRVLDIGGRLGYRVSSVAKPHDWTVDAASFSNLKRSIGAQHLAINIIVCKLGEALDNRTDLKETWREYCYSSLLLTICQVAENQGYDIESAMNEKIEFNAVRPDHKPENRAKKHGKRF